MVVLRHRAVMAVFFTFLLTFMFSIYTSVTAATPPVIVIKITGEINDGQAALVHRAMIDAQHKQAKAVIVQLDTFGGLVDSAVKIRDMLIESPITSICYIKNRAWSAGALIAISNKNIAIAPGGSIGAAEPIPATEKTIAALKAEFAATAQKTGRNPKVAEAMVDKTLGYGDYAKPGQILALTDYQAKSVGYADFIANDINEVLAYYQLSDFEILEYNMEASEKAAGFFASPAIKSILISIIFFAVLAEIKTAGMGVAAGIGILAALLFFGSQWFVGVIGWLEIVLFLGGIVLIIVEFFVPGITIFGVGGTLCILASLFFSLGGDMQAFNILAGSLFLGIILFLIIMKRLPSSKLWTKIVLDNAETEKAGFTIAQDYTAYLGKEGIVMTRLRPAGVIEIDGVQLDVVSEGKFLDQGTKVKVVSISGNRIVVRKVD